MTIKLVPLKISFRNRVPINFDDPIDRTYVTKHRIRQSLKLSALSIRKNLRICQDRTLRKPIPAQKGHSKLTR